MKELSAATRAYFEQRLRNRVFAFVLRRFKMSCISQETLAKRMGKSTAAVKRLLQSPSNMDLDMLASFLLAVGPWEADLVALGVPSNDYTRAHVWDDKSTTDNGENKMQHTSFKTKIGGKEYTIGAFHPELSTAPKTPRIHHILIIDRSGSMMYALNKLIDQIIALLAKIGDNDLLSLYWFSSVGEHKCVFKGTKKSADLIAKLNELRHTVGTTCFSEVLQDVKEAVAEFCGLVDQTVVTLFTDGNPVTPWSDDEEEMRSLNCVADMAWTLAAFNCIGYGAHYKRDFLINMSSKSDHGVMVHSSNIDQFHEIMEQGFNTARGITVGSLDVSTEKKTDIVYLGDNSANYWYDTSGMNMRFISQGDNHVYVVSAGDTDVIINGYCYSASKGRKATPLEKLQFFYTYAAKLYYHGKRRMALDIMLNNAKDRALVDAMNAAFTQSEVGEVQRLLDAAVFDSTQRYLNGKTPPRYAPAKNAFCVLDLFDRMSKNEGCAFYVPYGKYTDTYKRIGVKVEDKYNAFTFGPEEVRAPINDIIWNAEQFNLSLRFRAEGSVKLNPKAADNVGLPHDIPGSIWRTHTFVRDGAINIAKAEFLLDQSVIDAMPLSFVAKSMYVHGQESWNGKVFTRAVIDLSSLPALNRNYVDDMPLPEVYDSVTEITKLEAAQKVINFLVDDLVETSATLKKTGYYASYNAEQIRVLEEHGIRKDGIYGGIDNKVETAAAIDFYKARSMSFYLKGVADLPSIKDFSDAVAGKKKTINLGTRFMMDYHEDLLNRAQIMSIDVTKPIVETRNWLMAEQKVVRQKLRDATKAVNKVKMAKALTNDFFPGLTADEKGNYTWKKNEIDPAMILRVKYENIKFTA